MNNYYLVFISRAASHSMQEYHAIAKTSTKALKKAIKAWNLKTEDIHSIVNISKP